MHALFVFGAALVAGVIWPDAIAMATGAILGGTGLARRLGEAGVRRLVVAIGFTMAFTLMLRL